MWSVRSAAATVVETRSLIHDIQDITNKFTMITIKVLNHSSGRFFAIK